MKNLAPGDQEDLEIKLRQKLNGIHTKNELEQIIELAKEFSLAKIEAEAYKLQGDLNYSKNNFTEAFGYYSSSLSIYKNLGGDKSICYLYNRLGACKSNELVYLDALAYFTRAYYYSEVYNDEVIKRNSTYNIARCYKKLEKYDSAIEYIDEYLSSLNINESFENYAYASVLKANCLEAKGEIDNSISLSLDLIKQCKLMDHPILGFIYNNLGIVYMEKGDYDFSEQFFNEAERVREESDIDDLSFTYIDKARLYLKMGKPELALEFVNKGLQYGEEYRSEESLLHGYQVLIDIYSDQKDYKNLKVTYEKFIEIIKDKNCDEDLQNIYIKAALFHLEIDDTEICKKYLLESLE